MSKFDQVKAAGEQYAQEHKDLGWSPNTTVNERICLLRSRRYKLKQELEIVEIELRALTNGKQPIEDYL